tara:strand:+ start:3022 stop:3495 length:474 start_codon:yes stop_codon:yes gene_type:complete
MKYISKNFTKAEMIRSNTATRLGISNEPNEDAIDNLVLLAKNLLQPLRQHLGPIRITSGFRSPDLCVALGSKKTSQHTLGMAADCVFISRGKMDNKKLFDAVIGLNLEFDQMINEFDYKWIHISYNKDNNRKQILDAYKDENNKTKYQFHQLKFKSL